MEARSAAIAEGCGLQFHGCGLDLVRSHEVEARTRIDEAAQEPGLGVDRNRSLER